MLGNLFFIFASEKLSWIIYICSANIKQKTYVTAKTEEATPEVMSGNKSTRNLFPTEEFNMDKVW